MWLIDYLVRHGLVDWPSLLFVDRPTHWPSINPSKDGSVDSLPFSPLFLLPPPLFEQREIDPFDVEKEDFEISWLEQEDNTTLYTEMDWEYKNGKRNFTKMRVDEDITL